MLTAALDKKQDIFVVGGVFDGVNVYESLLSIADNEIIFAVELEKGKLTVTDKWQALTAAKTIDLFNPVTLEDYKFDIDIRLQGENENIENDNIPLWWIIGGVAGGVLVLTVLLSVIGLFKAKRNRYY